MQKLELSSVVNCSVSSSDSSQLEESLFMIWSVNASNDRVPNFKWSMKKLTLISISNKGSECL